MMSEQRYQQEARAVREQLDLALEAAAAGTWVWHIPEQRVEFSPQLLRLRGLSPEHFDGRLESVIAQIYPDDRERFRQALCRSVEEGAAFAEEYRIMRGDGVLREMLSRGRVQRDARGEAKCFFGVSWDVTELRSSQRQLQRLNRTYAAIDECNRLMIQAEDEQALLQAFCRSMVETGGYRFAWAGVPEQGAEGLIRPVARAGEDAGYLDEVRVSWSAQVPEGTGPTGRAVREGRIVATRSVDDAGFRPWHAAAAARGFASTAALPVSVRGQVALVLSLYAAHADAFDEQELGLLESLRGTLGFAVEGLRGRRARKSYEAQLEYQAQHDALTGLPNRSLLHDRLDQALAYARRHRRQIGVLFLDMDRFKLINDSLDHDAGDELLRVLGRRLAESVRAVDTVARYGGDEFALVLTELESVDQLQPTLRRIQAVLAEPVTVGGRSLQLTASIGIALFPADGEDAATLLRNADTAMYRAKELGRDQVQYYTAELNQRAVARLGLESALREALSEQRLWLAYQPQIDVRSGRIVGMEALVRWQDPERGAVSPAQFVPLAEETGLILPLGEWVLREACRQAQRWRQAGLHGFRVAVNVSARQIAHSNLAELVRRVLEETGLPAAALELELTETALMDALEPAGVAMAELSELGVRFALDDFGTGYSSLGYLKRFRFDTLKIDRSFVEHVVESPDDAAIVRAVIGIAHQLRMRVLAEGVESEAQLGYLQRHGCELVQGFYFSRAVEPGQAETLLRRGRLLDLPEPLGAERTLLLVENEPNILRALRRALCGEDYRLLAAGSAEEALELLAREPVQVIVADNGMPGISGIELLSRVKALYPEVVRIILSGYTDFRTISEAVNHGSIYKFIAKPWDDEELREQLREAFRLQGRLAPA